MIHFRAQVIANESQSRVQKHDMDSEGRRYSPSVLRTAETFQSSADYVWAVVSRTSMLLTAISPPLVSHGTGIKLETIDLRSGTVRKIPMLAKSCSNIRSTPCSRDVCEVSRAQGKLQYSTNWGPNRKPVCKRKVFQRYNENITGSSGRAEIEVNNLKTTE